MNLSLSGSDDLSWHRKPFARYLSLNEPRSFGLELSLLLPLMRLRAEGSITWHGIFLIFTCMKWEKWHLAWHYMRWREICLWQLNVSSKLSQISPMRDYIVTGRSQTEQYNRVSLWKPHELFPPYKTRLPSSYFWDRRYQHGRSNPLF